MNEPGVSERCGVPVLFAPVLRQVRRGQRIGEYFFGHLDFDELKGVRKELRLALEMDEDFNERRSRMFSQVNDAFPGAPGMPAAAGLFAS